MPELAENRGGIKASRRTRKIVDTRGTLNLTERSPGSTGSGVMTMTDGMPSNRVREARTVWISTSERLTSGGKGTAIEGVESTVTAIF